MVEITVLVRGKNGELKREKCSELRESIELGSGWMID